MTRHSPPGFQSAEEERRSWCAYEDELIRRYEENLPLTQSDKREAKRLIKARAIEASRD